MVVDSMIRVSTDEICAAIKDVFEDQRVVLEPAGALAIAGMMQYHRSGGLRNKTVVAISSGSNMDFNRLRFVSERSDTEEVLLSVTIPERPGAFKEFYSCVHPRLVTEFSYRASFPVNKQYPATASILARAQIVVWAAVECAGSIPDILVRR
mmetsp:Transcript_71394/g.163644  ORF Transcript_71394/g.163644 Transcript_71394/m.163644 type:complete len:152 (-) Transcript_71394:446-901(-)